MVYDRVYTPAGKYCRRAPPLHFLTKIVSGVLTGTDPGERYIEKSGKFARSEPSFLRNFAATAGRFIDAERFLSGQSAWDKTLPADRSIYGPGRRREGRAWEGEPGDGGYNMGYRGGPTPGGEQGPSFYYPGSHRGSQPSLLSVRFSATLFLSSLSPVSFRETFSLPPPCSLLFFLLLFLLYFLLYILPTPVLLLLPSFFPPSSPSTPIVVSILFPSVFRFIRFRTSFSRSFPPVCRRADRCEYFYEIIFFGMNGARDSERMR